MSFDPKMLAMLVAGQTEQAHDQLGVPRETSTTFRWATVTAADSPTASALRIQLDGDSAPLPFAPDTLVSGLNVGQRVWVQLFGKSIVVLGIYGDLSGTSALAQAKGAAATTTTGAQPQQTGGLGSYWRHSSGLQVCWYNGTQNVSVTSQYDALYLGNWTWIYPVAFASIPNLSIGQFQWGNGASWATGGGIGTTQAAIRVFDAQSRDSGSTTINLAAIGMWK